ncbi:MAG: hypothetical protein HZB68_04550 [Candidatus Aenigmarchaeota archaeon]|nr:hypothetical protein [Candidatus Aenigmarchaeota archaeon]
MEETEGSKMGKKSNFTNKFIDHMPFDVGSYSCDLNEKKWFGKIEMHVVESTAGGMEVDKFYLDAISKTGERQYIGCVLNGSDVEYKNVSASGITKIDGENMGMASYILGEHGIGIEKYFQKAFKNVKKTAKGD